MLSSWKGQWCGEEAAASAWALPWVNRPPSVQTTTVWPLSAVGPANLGRQAAKDPGFPGTSCGGSHTSEGACEGTGQKVIQTRCEEGRRRWWETEREQLALPGAEPRGAEGGPGIPNGQLPRQGLASGLVLTLVLTWKGTSGPCHLWDSVSSPGNQGTSGRSVVFKFKKKKKMAVAFFLQMKSYLEARVGMLRFQQAWICRSQLSRQPRALLK